MPSSSRCCRRTDEEHLPDAIHLPLKTLSADRIEGLDRTRPVVVYCWDAL